MVCVGCVDERMRWLALAPPGLSDMGYGGGGSASLSCWVLPDLLLALAGSWRPLAF